MSEFPDVIPQSLPGGRPLKLIAGESATDAEGNAGPLYAVSDDGPRGLATGRVLVRFSEEIPFNEQAAKIASAGFVVEQAMSYAPHAGWVHATSGRVSDALTNLGRLAELPGVEHIEPQLLFSRALK
jgi:hypothetical protein